MGRDLVSVYLGLNGAAGDGMFTDGHESRNWAIFYTP